MSNKNYDSQDRWAQKNNMIAKTYKLNEEITKEFQEACVKNDMPQSRVISDFMQSYIDLTNSKDASLSDTGKINIISVGQLRKFIEKYEDDVILDLVAGEFSFKINSYEKTPFSLCLMSNELDDFISKEEKKKEEVKESIKDVLNLM